MSPTDSFFPIMNTAEAHLNCPDIMSSSIHETTLLKDDDFKLTNDSVGIVKVVP